jgi:hypothetical protein
MVGISTQWRPGSDDVSGDPRALLTDRLLDDLDQDLLALFEEVLDLPLLLALAATLLGTAAVLRLLGRLLVVVLVVSSRRRRRRSLEQARSSPAPRMSAT